MHTIGPSARKTRRRADEAADAEHGTEGSGASTADEASGAAPAILEPRPPMPAVRVGMPGAPVFLDEVRDH